MTSLGVVKVQFQRAARGDIVALAQRKGGADGVSKLTNGMAAQDEVKVKALLKCSTGQGTAYHQLHYNGSVINGMLCLEL